MGVQETSREAYHNLDPRVTSYRERKLIALIELHGPQTNMELSQKMELGINIITPRTNVLVKKGILAEYEKRACTITGRRAIAWGKIKNTLF